MILNIPKSPIELEVAVRFTDPTTDVTLTYPIGDYIKDSFKALTKDVDTLNQFDTSTGILTIAEKGQFLLKTYCLFFDVSDISDSWDPKLEIIKTGVILRINHAAPIYFNQGPDILRWKTSEDLIIDLEKNDSIYFKASLNYQNGTGISKQDSLDGASYRSGSGFWFELYRINEFYQGARII